MHDFECIQLEIKRWGEVERSSEERDGVAAAGAAAGGEGRESESFGYGIERGGLTTFLGPEKSTLWSLLTAQDGPHLISSHLDISFTWLAPYLRS